MTTYFFPEADGPPCSLVRQPLIWRLRLVVGSCEETDYPTTFSQGVIYQTAPTPKWKGFSSAARHVRFHRGGKNEQRAVWKKREKKQHSFLRSVEKVRWLCVVSSVESARALSSVNSAIGGAGETAAVAAAPHTQQVHKKLGQKWYIWLATLRWREAICLQRVCETETGWG